MAPLRLAFVNVVNTHTCALVRAHDGEVATVVSTRVRSCSLHTVRPHCLRAEVSTSILCCKSRRRVEGKRGRG